MNYLQNSLMQRDLDDDLLNIQGFQGPKDLSSVQFDTSGVAGLNAADDSLGSALSSGVNKGLAGLNAAKNIAGMAGGSSTDLATGGLEGAASGASAGSVGGPWGAAIGAAAGLTAGLFGASAAEDAEKRKKRLEAEKVKYQGMQNALAQGGAGQSQAYGNIDDSLRAALIGGR